MKINIGVVISMYWVKRKKSTKKKKCLFGSYYDMIQNQRGLSQFILFTVVYDSQKSFDLKKETKQSYKKKKYTKLCDDNFYSVYL